MRVPISSIAEMLGVHQRTLRLWDEQNIVRPERSPKGCRLYTEQNIEEARAVSFMLNEMGLNINGVKALRAVYKLPVMKEHPLVTTFYQFTLGVAGIMELTNEQMQANKQSNKSKGRKKKEVS